jgi:hypothetical protein
MVVVVASWVLAPTVSPVSTVHVEVEMVSAPSQADQSRP